MQRPTARWRKHKTTIPDTNLPGRASERLEVDKEQLCRESDPSTRVAPQARRRCAGPSVDGVSVDDRHLCCDHTLRGRRQAVLSTPAWPRTATGGMNNARPSRSCSHPTCRAHRCSLHRWPSTRHMPCLLSRHSAQRLRPPNMQMDATPECIRTQARVLVCKGLTTVALAPGADQRKVIHSLAHPSTHSRIICEPHQMYGRYVQTPSRGNGNVALQPHILSFLAASRVCVLH